MRLDTALGRSAADLFLQGTHRGRKDLERATGFIGRASVARPLGSSAGAGGKTGEGANQLEASNCARAVESGADFLGHRRVGRPGDKTQHASRGRTLFPRTDGTCATGQRRFLLFVKTYNADN